MKRSAAAALAVRIHRAAVGTEGRHHGLCGRTEGLRVIAYWLWQDALYGAALPGTFDHLRGDEQRSIVVVVSTLVALMPSGVL